MSTLSKLKLCAVQKSAHSSPLTSRRQNMAARISEQIKIAQAQAGGIKYARVTVRNTRDDVTGEQTEHKKFQYPTPWWWVGDAGKVYLNVKYGARTLELSKGKATVEVGSMADLVATLEKIKQAVESQELDPLLANIPVPARKAKATAK